MRLITTPVPAGWFVFGAAVMAFNRWEVTLVVAFAISLLCTFDPDEEENTV